MAAAFTAPTTASSALRRGPAGRAAARPREAPHRATALLNPDRRQLQSKNFTGRGRSRRSARPLARGPGAIADADDGTLPVGHEEEEEEEEDPYAQLDSFRFLPATNLYGEERFERLANAHVCVFGLGSVGSWAAEALVRSGVRKITMVDLDEACVSGVSRQLLSMNSTVGTPKAEAMAKRFKDISPSCEVHAVNDFVSSDNVAELLSDRPDFVLDAVPRDESKAALIAYCTWAQIPLLVTGGVGGIDSLGELVVEDMAKATYNHLLAHTRKILRQQYGFPHGQARQPSERAGSHWGVRAAYVRESRNRYAAVSDGDLGDQAPAYGVGHEEASTLFVSAPLGFKAAECVALAIMEQGKKNVDKDCPADGHPADGHATDGWRARVWPKKGGGENNLPADDE